MIFTIALSCLFDLVLGWRISIHLHTLSKSQVHHRHRLRFVGIFTARDGLASDFIAY